MAHKIYVVVLITTIQFILTSCATTPPIATTKALIFEQGGKRASISNIGANKIITLKNRPFSLILPEKTPTLQICLSHRKELLIEAPRFDFACFARGTGMAIGKREGVNSGWTLRLNKKFKAHNYFNESRMLSIDGKKVIKIKNFDPVDREARTATTLYMVAFIDTNGDGEWHGDELAYYTIKLDKPLRPAITNGIHEFTTVLKRIRTDYVDDIPMNKLVDSAIIGFYQGAGQTLPNDAMAISSSNLSPMGRIRHAFKTVRRLAPNADTSDIWIAGISKMVNNLGDKSTYIAATESSTLLSPLEKGGIGITIHFSNTEELIIEEVFPDTPAAKNGINVGDKLLKIDGIPVSSLSLRRATRMLRGSINSDIKLTLMQNGKKRKLLLRRERIINPHFECRIINDQILYIRPYNLSIKLGKKLEGLARRLARDTRHSPSKVILDLRNNNGGVLNTAIHVSDLFIETGTIANFQSHNSLDTMQTFKAVKNNDIFTDAHLTVLVNQHTYSGAELIAAALQDNDRASILGQQTAGVADIYTLFPLDDGFLKLTTARIVRPSGVTISDKGVTPDVRFSEVSSYSKSLVQDESACPGNPEPLLPLHDDAALRHALDIQD